MISYLFSHVLKSENFGLCRTIMEERIFAKKDSTAKREARKMLRDRRKFYAKTEYTPIPLFLEREKSVRVEAAMNVLIHTWKGGCERAIKGKIKQMLVVEKVTLLKGLFKA